MESLSETGMCKVCDCKLSQDGTCPRCKFRGRPRYSPSLIGRLTQELESGKWDTRGPMYRLLDACKDALTGEEEVKDEGGIPPGLSPLSGGD